jgi:mono/diheme cytochrome c family protein
MKKVLSTMAIVAIIAYSCSKGGDPTGGPNEPPPGGGNNNCDTANSQYMADVVPILTNNCYRCHGAATNSGSFGIVLEGYSNLKPYAESGTLIGVITHANGFTPMPQDGGKLSDCNINKIRSWIAHGIQNN